MRHVVVAQHRLTNIQMSYTSASTHFGGPLGSSGSLFLRIEDKDVTHILLHVPLSTGTRAALTDRPRGDCGVSWSSASGVTSALTSSPSILCRRPEHPDFPLLNKPSPFQLPDLGTCHPFHMKCVFFRTTLVWLFLKTYFHFIWKAETVTEGYLPSMDLFSQMTTMDGTEPEQNQESDISLPCGWREPKDSGHQLLPPKG